MEGTRVGFLKIMVFFSTLHDFLFGFFFLFFLPQMEYILLFPEPLNFPIFGHFVGLLLLFMGIIQLISLLNLERFILFLFIISCERICFFIIGIFEIVYMPSSVLQIIIFISIDLFLGLLTFISIKISNLSLKIH
ncbi:MAG: hypothetical protein ACTSPY_12890 [Candidatus Helarchaeota archaeon]